MERQHNSVWRKSSHSGHDGGECIEVSHIPGGIAVRDSKCPDGPVVMLARGTWRRLIGDLKSL